MLVSSLLTETGLDMPDDDRVGKPCRSGSSVEDLQVLLLPCMVIPIRNFHAVILQARFTSTEWDWSALQDPTMWAKKAWLDGADPGTRGWCHPQPKEQRFVPFRELLQSFSENGQKIAVVGHESFLRKFVDVKMTSCQMYFQDSLPDLS